MNIVKTLFPMALIIVAITACSDTEQKRKVTEKVNAEFNSASEDLRRAVEHTKNAAVSAADEIKEGTAETAEKQKI